ncbi:MAG: YibE/F family protein [Acidimicrobiia bacterium]|nr:YibE/F family protein [Acidimicrobiia bacterium]
MATHWDRRCEYLHTTDIPTPSTTRHRGDGYPGSNVISMPRTPRHLSGPEGDSEADRSLSWDDVLTGDGLGDATTPPEESQPEIEQAPSPSGPAHRHPRRDESRTNPIFFLVAIIALLTLVLLVVLWPREPIEADLSPLGVSKDAFRAEVVASTDAECSFSAEMNCHRVTFLLEEGPDAGNEFVQEFEISASAPRFDPGDGVVLNHIPNAEEDFRYQFADRERRGLLITALGVFAFAVIALARLKGVTALLGLALSVIILLAFIIPAILVGREPVVVAAVGGSAIALITLYLAHGWRRLTHVAAVGLFAALLVTILISVVFFGLAQFSGLATEEATYLTLVPGVGISGLLLAGAILGALGALDDVAIAQASAVWELKTANPSMDQRELLHAGLRVGRDHIASTVNTLLLAYAGAAMPLLLLFHLSGQPFSVLANSEVVAVEILRTLVGSIGLVSAIPITTWLASREVTTRPPRVKSVRRYSG